MSHILIVDDHEENLLYLQSLLTSRDCTVESARHGAEALVKARQSPPGLIVSDLLMPVMDGYTLLRHWKTDAQLKAIPFIVYTATYTDAEDERLALSLGADAFILKPAEPEDFLACIRKVQSKEAAAEPMLAKRPIDDEEGLLKNYSETLIRKLEEKTLQLEESNRALREDVVARENAELAQRQMADRQRAILNALPAHIALVDAEGVILSVNDAWGRFASANVLQGPDFCIGQNYLEVCEQATGGCSVEAKEAAAGIRRVLAGEEKEFSTEYPCHSPSEPRWFRLMVTPLRDDARAGAVIMHVNITARKLSENMVRESEQRLNFALSAADIGDWSLDLRTNVAHRSLRHDQCFGYRELLPVWGYDTFFAHVDPADREHVDESFQKAMAGEGEYDDEFRTVWADGSVHWLWARGQFYFDKTGTPYRVAGIIADITERRKTRDSLRESEQRLELATASAQIGIWDWDVVANRMVWDEQMYALYGIREHDFSGAYNAWQKGLHPEDQARAEAEIQAALAGTRDFHTEFRVRWPSGEVRYIEAHGLVRRAGDGSPTRMIGVNWDITERKRSENRLRRLLESNAQGVLFWNTKGKISGSNAAFLAMTGYSRRELDAGELKWSAMTPPEFAEVDRRALEEMASKGVCVPFEKEFIRKDGTRLPILIGAAIFEDNPEEGVGFVLDLTERKKLEQQFLRAQRMESIGTLAGGIAHDLNNVFGPIMMSLDLLKMKFPDPASQNLISVLNASALHGADMVRQILSFARGVEGRRMEVQVRHLIGDIGKIVRETFLKHIEVRTNVPNGLWTVLGDPTQLHQVLLNLCVNARDAMPSGGSLTISAENLTLDQHYVGLNPEATSGPHVFIRVEDTGTGIPSEIIEKIFDPFFTTKEVGKGTGLGLSTSQAIIKSHGGFLRVYSEPGKGTKFQIYLPAQTETSPEAAAAIEIEMPRGNGELILVADDEASVRQITQQTLEAFGYRVVLACDGAETVAIFARQSAEIDAVLTDMTMPVMDGPATIHVLRKMNPKVPIIAASGLSVSAQVVQAKSLNVKHFLSKPYTADTLLKALREVLSPGQ